MISHAHHKNPTGSILKRPQTNAPITHAGIMLNRLINISPIANSIAPSPAPRLKSAIRPSPVTILKIHQKISPGFPKSQVLSIGAPLLLKSAQYGSLNCPPSSKGLIFHFSWEIAYQPPFSLDTLTNLCHTPQVLMKGHCDLLNGVVFYYSIRYLCNGLDDRALIESS